MAKKVGIYAGHGTMTDGGWDSGCVYTKDGKTYTEAKLMMPIAESCAKYLKASGVTVYDDVPKNERNMVKQVALSNSKGVAVHVAFHCDYSKAPKGTIPLYYSPKGKKLASLMNKWVMKYSGLTTRGVCRRTDLYELTATNMVSVIFEVGSIKADLNTMLKKYDEIGKGAAHGICDYLGVKFKDTKKPTKKSGIVMHPRGYFQYGDKGDSVRTLQTWLNKHGYKCGNVDGKFGDKTLSAVKKFQKANGLEVDGKFGKKSLAIADKIGG